jgi:hypothetical protein
MTDLTRFITRKGRRIEVEILPTDAKPSKARQREAKAFAKIPLQWAADAAKALGAPQSFVPIWIRHQAWKTKSLTFTLSNAALVKYGVKREAKRRALASLEAAGMIKVERLPGRATIVTLLIPEPDKA